MSLLKLYTAVADQEEAVGPDPWLNMFLSIYLWFTVGRLFISVGTLHSHPPPPSAKMTSIDFCKVHVFRTSFLGFVKLIPHEWNRINHPVYKTKKSTRLMFVVICIFTVLKSDYARSFFWNICRQAFFSLFKFIIVNRSTFWDCFLYVHS